MARYETHCQSHYRRLIKLDAAWRYTRWLQVLCGGFGFALGVFLVYQAYERASAAETWNEEAVVYYPMGMLLFTLGAAMCVIALAKWRGDPVVALLLKVLRERETLKESEAKGEKSVRNREEGIES